MWWKQKGGGDEGRETDLLASDKLGYGHDAGKDGLRASTPVQRKAGCRTEKRAAIQDNRKNRGDKRPEW